jgi:serine/threonine protein phosphatase PrpC
LVSHLQAATSYEEALYLTYQSLFNELIKSQIDITFSGTTATTCFLKGRELKVANSGDSRCIIGCQRNNLWGLKEITKDHKPDVASERQRIVESGGRVESYINSQGDRVGPLRVWLKGENIPGLAMTRAVGDLVATTVGVSWEPGRLFFF